MLVISGLGGRLDTSIACLFQSRNRDACHFRFGMRNGFLRSVASFQSRNRDACHFRSIRLFAMAAACIPLFQSRNRDACHFRPACSTAMPCNFFIVSISQSRCLSFQVCEIGAGNGYWAYVSISQSRCLSFQAHVGLATARASLFQSRNRDACHFRKESRLGQRASTVNLVSISQSRCLSFQVCAST